MAKPWLSRALPPRTALRRRTAASDVAATASKHSRKAQYELLLPFYKEEAERYEALSKRASMYLTVLGAISLLGVVKLESTRIIFQNPVVATVALATLNCIFLALWNVVESVRLREYKTPIKPRDFVLQAEAESFTEDDSYSLLLSGLVQSIDANREKNNQAAAKLETTLRFGTLAIVFSLLLNVLVMYFSYQEVNMSQSKSGTSGQQSTPATDSKPPSKTPMSELLKPQVTETVKKGEVPPYTRNSGPGGSK
jgi:hypothetical protein